MFKRFKRNEIGDIIAYHEVWVDLNPRRIVEHWGMIGERGETHSHRIKLLSSLEKQVNALLEPAEALGFHEIDEGDFATLIVEYPVNEAWQKDDDDKIEAASDAINEILGWTGLGHCEDTTVNDANIQLTCRVLDVNLATEQIASGLKPTELGDYSRIYQE